MGVDPFSVSTPAPWTGRPHVQAAAAEEDHPTHLKQVLITLQGGGIGRFLSAVWSLPATLAALLRQPGNDPGHVENRLFVLLDWQVPRPSGPAIQLLLLGRAVRSLETERQPANRLGPKDLQLGSLSGFPPTCSAP